MRLAACFWQTPSVLEKVLASHALIHTADGELFREALLHASNRCGLGDFRIKEKELLDRAGQVFAPNQKSRCAESPSLASLWFSMDAG